MNNIRAIPQELLGESFTLIIPNGDGFDEILVRNVRVKKKSAVSDYSSARMRDVSELVIYYDCANSLPHGLDFTAGMQLEYGGELFEVLEAKLFCGTAPHHRRITARKIGTKEG